MSPPVGESLNRHRASTVSPAAVTLSSQVAVVIIAAVVVLVNSTLPAALESFARTLQFNPSMQGAFGSADNLGMMLGSLLAIVAMRNASPSVVVRMALLLLLATDLGSLTVRWPQGLIALRLVGGFGTGLAWAACSYVCGLKDPERMAGATQLAVNGLSLLIVAATPVVVHHLGYRGIFLCLAILTIPALALSRKLPSNYHHRQASPTLATTANPSVVRTLLRWSGLVGVVLGTLCISSFWTFLGRIGAESGLAEQTIANSLSISILCATLGAATTIMCGPYLRLKALLSSILITAMGIAAAHSSTPWIFCAAISLFNLGVTVSTVVAFGMIMRKPPVEQFAVHIGGAQMTAQVVGPLTAGFVAQKWGFDALREICLAAVLLAGVSYWVYVRVAYSARHNPPFAALANHRVRPHQL